MVISGTWYSAATGSIATISVPKTEVAAAIASLLLNALSRAVAAPVAEVPVSKIGWLASTPAGAFSIAITAPLRWLPPSTDMKPVIGMTIGIVTSAANAEEAHDATRSPNPAAPTRRAFI